jgi:hypothetical protein
MAFRERLSVCLSGPLPDRSVVHGPELAIYGPRWRQATRAAAAGGGVVSASLWLVFVPDFVSRLLAAVLVATLGYASYTSAVSARRGPLVVRLTGAGICVADHTIAWPQVRATMLVDDATLLIDVVDGGGEDVEIHAEGVDFAAIQRLIEYVAFGPVPSGEIDPSELFADYDEPSGGDDPSSWS